MLESSQPSYPGSPSARSLRRTPSPHTATVQKLVQASLVSSFWSSHCSPVWTIPSPRKPRLRLAHHDLRAAAGVEEKTDKK